MLNFKSNTKETVANDSRATNAERQRVNETASLIFNFERRLSRWATKKVLVGAFATVCIAFASILLFYGCTKDGNEKFRKDGLPEGNTEFKEYEDYFPDESTVYEKLVQIMECVNNPSENHLPNMELKEAVWFLDCFFL